MSVHSNNRRKGLNVANLDKNKFTTKHNETKSGTHDKSEAHEHMDNVKKSDVLVSMNAHLKSDVDKSLYADAQEKASGEPYVHEFKEFPGVTIIFRTAANPKAFANLEAHGKTGNQNSRRKSEHQHSQLNTHDKSEHGDKIDHTGGNFPVFASKSDNLTHNSNGASGHDNQH